MSRPPVPDYHERMDALIRIEVAASLGWTSKVTAYVAAVALFAGAARLWGGGLWELLFFLPPILFLTFALVSSVSAHRGLLSKTHASAFLVLFALVPGGRALLSLALGPEGPAALITSPDHGVWLVLIIASGLLLERRLGYLIAALGIAQYLMMFALARPVFLEMTGPHRVIEGLVTLDSAFGKCAVLAVAALLVGKTSKVVRGVMGQLLEEERQRHQEESARTGAERASQAKSAFLAHINHELRTPLNAILGYAQVLLTRHDLNEKQRDGLRIIRDSGFHLLGLINEVLDISKIESGRVELSLAPVALHDLLEGVTRALQAIADSKSISLRLHIGDGVPPTVFADEKRLRQILLNLVGNAVKCTARGGVSLRVTREPGGAPSALRFEVEDTGSGIESDQLQAIFEPFRQAGQHQGTGLGLPISQRLVRLMGGEIQVESAEGEGSSFWFVVSLESAIARPPRPRPAHPSGYLGATRHVLVADDRRLNRVLMQEMLAGLGFSVELVCDGAAAIAAFSERRPDLILMDLHMPVLDGVQAAARIRALEGQNDRVPIVAVTANSLTLEQGGAQAHGFDATLSKPVDLAELTEALALHLGLTWAGDSSQESEASGTPILPESSPQVWLAPDVLAALRDLVEIGDLHEVQERAAALAQADPRLAPFAQRIRVVASRFDDAAMVALLDTVDPSSSPD